VPPAFAAPAQDNAPQSTLYKRLGGYDMIASITDDVFGHAVADPQLTRFFKGNSLDTQNGRGRMLSTSSVQAPVVLAFTSAVI
jgi:hypothetical protein